MRFLFDPGHGGRDPGAVGPAGNRESDIALAVSLMIKGHIGRPEIKCDLTRYTDDFVSLEHRCHLANNKEATLISIHCNAAESSQASGFEVWTSPGWTASDPIATKLWGGLKQEFPDMRARLDTSDGDPDKEANFKVLTGTIGPAVLVELGFISNPEEEMRLASIPFQVRAARTIALVLAGVSDG